MSSWPYPPFEPSKSNTSGIPGPVGPRGAPGADSTVPGPQGPPGAPSTVPGPAGAAGRDGVDAEEALTTVYVDGFAATRYVAYRGATVDASGQVSALEAVSGGKVATAAPPACPVVTTGRRNGRPYLTFNQPVGRNMLVLPFALIGRGDLAVFIVYRLAVQKSSSGFTNCLFGDDNGGYNLRGVAFGGVGSSLVVFGSQGPNFLTVGPDSLVGGPKLTTVDHPELRDPNVINAICVQWVAASGAANVWANGQKLGSFTGRVAASGVGTVLGDASASGASYPLTGDILEFVVMECPSGRSYTRTTGGLTDSYTALVFERLRQRWALPYAALTPAPDAATLYLKRQQGEVGPPSTVPGPVGPAGRDAATDSATLVLYGGAVTTGGNVYASWSTAVMHQAIAALTSFPTNFGPIGRSPRIDFSNYFTALGPTSTQRMSVRVSVTVDGPIGTLYLRVINATPGAAPTVRYSYPFVGVTSSGVVREFLFTMGIHEGWTALGFYLESPITPPQFTAVTLTAEFRDRVPATTQWQTYDVPPVNPQ